MASNAWNDGWRRTGDDDETACHHQKVNHQLCCNNSWTAASLWPASSLVHYACLVTARRRMCESYSRPMVSFSSTIKLKLFVRHSITNSQMLQELIADFIWRSRPSTDSVVPHLFIVFDVTLFTMQSCDCVCLVSHRPHFLWVIEKIEWTWITGQKGTNTCNRHWDISNWNAN